MKLSFASSRQSLFLLFIFLLIAAIFTIFYFKQVDDRKDQLIQRDFRQLNEISTALQSRVNGLSTVISTIMNSITTKNTDTIKSIIQSQMSGLDSIKVEPPEKMNIVNNSKNSSVKDSESTRSNNFAKTDTTEKNQYKGYFNPLKTWFASRNDSILLAIKKIYASYPIMIKVKGIDELIEKKKKQNLFDDFFMAKNDGNVISFSKTMSISIIKKVVEINKKDSVNFSEVSTSDAIAKYTLGGEDYMLFIHPTRLFSYFHDKKEWIICGMIRVDKFQKESQAVSANVILVFIIIIILLALSWPLLKLRFAGRLEHIRTSDIILASLSILFLAAIFTFALLDIFVSIHESNKVDRKLNSLAVNLGNNFLTEIKEIDRELDSISKNYGNKLKPEKYVYVDSVKDVRKYLYFDMVAWIDSNGMQKYKLLMKRKETSFVSVQNRDYYRNVANHNLWNIDGIKKGIFVQPIITWTTGDFATTLSKEVYINDTSYVEAIDFIPLSIYSPVLPKGYSYCIIDANGQVLFHSNPDINLLENFFKECDNSGFIKSAVKSKTKEYFNTNYWGKEIKGMIYPLNGLPWFVVTMYDQNILVGSNVVITSLSFTLFMLYLIPFFAFLIIFMMVKTSHRNSIWPQVDKIDIYLKLMIIYTFFSAIVLIYYISSGDLNNIFIVTWLYPHSAMIFGIILLITKLRRHEVKDDKKLAVFIFLIIFIDTALVYSILNVNDISLRNIWLILVIWILATLSAACFLLNLSFFKSINSGLKKFHKNLSYEKSIQKTAKIYALTFTSLLILGAIIPTVGFFNISYQIEFKSIIKQTQSDFYQKMKEREQRIKDKYKPATYSFSNTLYTDRLNNTLDIYLPDNSKIKKFSLSKKDPSLDLSSSWIDSTIIDEIIPRFHQANITTLTLLKKPNYLDPADKSYMFVTAFQKPHQFDSNSGVQNKRYVSISKSDPRNEAVAFSTITTKIPKLKNAFLSEGTAGKIFLKLLFLLIIISFGLYLLYAIILYITKSSFLINANDLSYLLKDNRCIKEITSNVLLLSGDKDLTKKIDSEILPAEKESNESVDLEHINLPDMIEDSTLGIKNKNREKHSQNFSSNKEEKNSKRVIIIDNFEYGFSDPKINSKKLSFLEEEIYVKKSRVIILSSINPFGGFCFNEPGEDIKIRQQTLKRWKDILSGFVSLSWCYNLKETELSQNGSKQVTENKKPFLKFLRSVFIPIFCSEDMVDRELKSCIILNFHPELLLIARKLGKIKNVILEEKNLDESSIFDIVMEKTRSYHQQLWDLCSMEEKFVLTRLVKDRLVSVSNIKVVETLLRRGLIKREPNLKPFNCFFTQFIRETGFTEEDCTDKKEMQNGWGMFRAPILLILLGILIFLFATQSEIYQTTLAIIPTITIIIPFVLKLLGVLQSKQTLSKESE